MNRRNLETLHHFVIKLCYNKHENKMKYKNINHWKNTSQQHVMQNIKSWLVDMLDMSCPSIWKTIEWNEIQFLDCFWSATIEAQTKWKSQSDIY